MKNLIKSNTFIVGFLFGFIAFLYVTELIERKFSVWGKGICFDCSRLTGFPFPYHQDSSFVDPPHFLWFGLIADIVIAIVFSFVVGLIFRLVWSKIKMQKLR
jgi:hypothetical protein